MTGSARVVTVMVSAPYTLIAGGWTGMRPVGRRRTYSAVIDGRRFENTCKATLQSVIQSRLRRDGHEGRIRFEFVDEPDPSRTDRPGVHGVTTKGGLR